DLANALRIEDARKQFDDLPFSVRRGTLEFIKTAKTEPTRTKRITEIVKWAREGKALPGFRRN
ncbi:MAG: YdeI/OmpD-associated family protein, partial [Pseudomonadota bacterium]